MRVQLSKKVHITSKQPHLKESIFAIMSRMAIAHNALNLSQGYPDFPCHPKLMELIAKYVKLGYNQYAPMPGIIPLREKIVAKMEAAYNVKYNVENEITITSGATEALYAAITSVVMPGDEVILFEPWYDAYLPMVEYSGGTAISIPLNENDYSINWQRAKQAVNKKTKAIVINSPHNPTGAVINSKDLQQLKALVKDTPIIIISDEVYEHIIFDGLKHYSLASDPELASRSFVISSFGKVFHATGWKVGYALAPQPLMREFQKIHQFITFSVNTPAQYAYAEFMDAPEHYLQLGAFYQQKRDAFLKIIEHSRFKPIPCSGTYFQLVKYDAISNKNDIDFSAELTQKYKIASIPTSVFYNKKHDAQTLRFCFAKSDETLNQAAELLCKI